MLPEPAHMTLLHKLMMREPLLAGLGLLRVVVPQGKNVTNE